MPDQFSSHQSRPETPPVELWTGSSSLFPEGRGTKRIDFRAVRQIVTMAQVLELLDWRSTGGRGDQLRGPCVLHASEATSRSFSVNLAKHAFRCFKCGEEGNQLDLYAKATKLSLREAAFELCRRLAISPPPAD